MLWRRKKIPCRESKAYKHTELQPSNPVRREIPLQLQTLRYRTSVLYSSGAVTCKLNPSFRKQQSFGLFYFVAFHYFLGEPCIMQQL